MKYCGHCVYFEGYPESLGSHGKCRRYPPVIDQIQVLQAHMNSDLDGKQYANGALLWAFPHVFEDEWCGEWKRKHAGSNP